jgi:hypothetical protein
MIIFPLQTKEHQKPRKTGKKADFFSRGKGGGKIKAREAGR